MIANIAMVSRLVQAVVGILIDMNAEELREFIAETIRQCKPGDSKDGKNVCLYSKSTGRLLGRHKSKKSAREQEKAIKARGD